MRSMKGRSAPENGDLDQLKAVSLLGNFRNLIAMKEVRLPAKRKEQRKRASRWLVVTVSFLFLSPLLPAQAPQGSPVHPFLGVTAADRFGVEVRHLALGRRLPWLTAGADKRSPKITEAFRFKPMFGYNYEFAGTEILGAPWQISLVLYQLEWINWQGVRFQ